MGERRMLSFVTSFARPLLKMVQFSGQGQGFIREPEGVKARSYARHEQLE